MKIEEYLKVRGRKQALAQVLGVNKPFISRLLSGEFRWSPDLAEKASVFSGGQVSIEEILYPEGVRPGARLCKKDPIPGAAE